MEPLIGEVTAPADVVRDSDTAHFMEDVVEASREVPVIVDFWAPWCGPCKTLGPMIEKVVKGFGGKVRLVKINVDENQQLAGQLRVQSIPAVFAFKDGQPVDGFVGALPESQIKAFIDQLAGDGGPSPVEQAVEHALEVLAAGDAATALEIFRQVLQAEPDNVKATAGLAQCHIHRGELDQAGELLDNIDIRQQSDPAVQSARAALDLAGQMADVGDLGELQARVEQDPADHQARLDLSNALVAAGRREEAIEQLLESIRRDRKWNEEAARKQLVTLFDAFGPASDLTVSARRRLSTILFS